MSDSRGRAARMFQVDQVLILTGMGGTELAQDFGNGEQGTKLYAVRFAGDDYDLKAAGADDHARQVAVVLDGLEMVLLARSLLNLLIDAGEADLIIDDLIAETQQREAKDGGLS